MTITIHTDLVQGSDEWHEIRRGIMTASEMKHVITPTLKIADNEKTRSHVYELAAQRISKFVEPAYVNDEMLKGHESEEDACTAYNTHFAGLERVGFITNDKFGFVIGYSPDALVGTEGAVEVKGRRQKYHVETIIDGVMPADYLIQVQTGLLVSERKWCDYISYHGGLPMMPIRVFSDPIVQGAIIAAATVAEARIVEKMAAYEAALKVGKWVETERRVEQEMFV